MKQIFSFFLALIMLLSMVPATVFATEAEETALPAVPAETPQKAEPPKKATTAEDVTGGKCGDNLVWELNEHRYLIISGTGPMYDYSEEAPAPWGGIKSISKIILRDGMTRIGDYAFATISHTPVRLAFPRTVKEVGSRVFSGRSFKVTFLGGCIPMAEDAFASSSGTAYYRAGWNEEDRRSYGAGNLTWERFNVEFNASTKKFYQQGEPILAEDIRLTVTNIIGGYVYVPQEIQTSSYDNSVPGKKTVQVLADGFAFTHEYIVVEGEYKDLITATVPVQTYTKEAITPNPTVMLGSERLVNGRDYTVSYQNNDKVGTDASVTITGLGQFSAYRQVLPMAILKRDLSGSGVGVEAQTFTGSPVTPEVSVKVAGEKLEAGKDFIAFFENNINIGTATVRVVGINNYCGTEADTFPIQADPSSISLFGNFNGNIDGALDMENYYYKEHILTPGIHTFTIPHTVSGNEYNHVANYQLYRQVGDTYQLVTSKETELGYGATTAFKYDFSSIYEDDAEAGGAVYMLSCTWVDTWGRVYSTMRSLIFPAKMPDTTVIVPEPVDVVDFRHGYITAYGLNGALGSVTWSSSDPSVADISNGVFTMHKPGTVTITAQSGSIRADSQIQVIAEDLSQGDIFAFDPAAKTLTVIYDGRILEEGTDYTTEIAQTSGLWEVAVTGTGVFKGQLIRYFDADGNGASHSHGFPSTCHDTCVRCDLRREPETEHRYETQKDEETHWQVCIYCGDRKDEAPHVYQNGNTSLCTQCGQIPAPPQEPEITYPPSDIDAPLLTKPPVAGSTVILGYNGFAMGTDRAGIGLAPIPGKLLDDKLAVTDGMAQLEVRTEGDTYLFVLDGKYLTCGMLGTTLYFSDTITGYSRWYIEEGENSNLRIINANTQLAISFLYSFAPYFAENNPLCQLQLYQVGSLPQLPASLPKLDAPTMLNGETNTTDGTCFLAWSSVPYADAYEVYRSTSLSGSYTKLATVNCTYYTDEVDANKTYYYKVKAVYTPNTAKNSDFSTAVSFSSRLQMPEVQLTLNEKTGRIDFSWQAVTGAKEYEIYRADSTGGYTLIGTTTKTTYTDTKAIRSEEYRYQFRAVSANSACNSELSKVYKCQHLFPRPKVTIKLDSKRSCPVVSWDKVDGATKYTILYKYPGDEEFRIDSNYQGTSLTFTRAPGDSLCIFRVYPLGDEFVPMESLLYTEVSIVTGIATPNFNCHVANGHIKATWEAVNGAVSYELYRSTKEKSGYTLLATITDGFEYLDTDTPVGKKFYYKLVAVGNLSRSKDSVIRSIAACCARPEVTTQRNEKGKPLLSWDKVEGAKQYTVYGGTSPYEMKKLGTTKSLSYVHTKAKAGVTYYYYVIANASSSRYNSTSSPVVTCSVGSGTPVVTAKADAATGKPSLTWGKVDGAVKYRIYRKMPGEEDFTILIEQTATSYLDSSVPIDTLCSYKVQALGKTEELSGDPSREISVASALARPELTATTAAATGIPTFTWTAVEGAVNYGIYRSTKSTSGYSLVTTVDGTSYVDDTASVGKTYYYKLVAMGNVGKSAETAYVKLSCKCGTPEITVENGTTGKPVISWEKISGAKKYTVYRATSETGKYSKLGTTTKLTYTDSKAKTGTQYFYKVIANASSSTYNSGYSNIESCNVICSSVTVTVKVDAATGKPSLSWKKVDGAAGYRILRQLPGEEDFTVIKEQTALTFLDTTAPIDTQCIYLVQVMGKTAALDSQMSKEISATSGIAKPVLKTSVDASGKPELRWQTVEGAVKYEIYRSTKSTKSYSLLTTVEATGYTDESVIPGKTYYYKVIAIGAVSKSAESSYAKLSGKCATPLISVSINEDSGKPQLSWEKISGAKKYTVYRATSETGKYSKLGTTTKLTYTDSKATVGKTYYYKLVANASSGSYSSAYSNIVSSVTICAKPVVKATTAASTGKPQLSWSKVSGAKEYWILLDVDGQAQLLTTTTKLSFVDEAAVPGETRRYAVWAVNADPVCNSAMDAYTVTATCAQPKIKGAVGETGKPEITITAVEGATKYVIYRSTSKSKNYKAIDEVEGLTFTDDAAKKGKTYYYKVVAVCEDTTSAQSSYVKVKSK